MEIQPPQQPPISTPTIIGSGRSATPPWLWLLLMGGFALIFWQFVPKTEVLVDYNPWFLDQVKKNNIKSISVQGLEIRGELRTEDVSLNDPPVTSAKVRKFYTYAPSDASIYPLELQLVNNEVRIVGNSPNPATGMAWIMLLLPTFVILGFIYLMLRRARDRFDKNTP
jgi:cell division protease FtsH